LNASVQQQQLQALRHVKKTNHGLKDYLKACSWVFLASHVFLDIGSSTGTANSSALLRPEG
jgi:hypothetical protein